MPIRITCQDKWRAKSNTLKNKFYITFGRESEGVLYGQEQRNPHLMRVNLITVAAKTCREILSPGKDGKDILARVVQPVIFILDFITTR